MEVDPSLPAARKKSENTGPWLMNVPLPLSLASLINLSFTGFVKTGPVTAAILGGSAGRGLKCLRNKAFGQCNVIPNGNAESTGPVL
jgi:hypothetical protein